jgi:hypothetical protein
LADTGLTNSSFFDSLPALMGGYLAIRGMRPDARSVIVIMKSVRANVNCAKRCDSSNKSRKAVIASAVACPERSEGKQSSKEEGREIASAEKHHLAMTNY